MSATERDDCCAEKAVSVSEAKAVTIPTRPLCERVISTSTGRNNLSNVAYSQFVAQSLQAMMSGYGRRCSGPVWAEIAKAKE
jgi:hypothetical protein